MQVGIIGFGRLGKLLSRYLSQDFDLKIYEVRDLKDEIEKCGAKVATLEEIGQCPLIIPMVPIGKLQTVLKEISSHIRKDALVIDVCSVKSLPLEWMKMHLPSTVQILGSHPMFGPDSAKETLFGAKIVLCPERIEEKLYSKIKSYLNAHGLKIIESTGEEHDRQISQSLLLTHFVGHGLIETKAKQLSIDTKGYRRLMKILQTVENDSWELFEDMNKYNPYAGQTLTSFCDQLEKIKHRASSC